MLYIVLKQFKGSEKFLSPAHLQLCTKMQTGLHTAIAELDNHLAMLHAVYAASVEEEATAVHSLLGQAKFFQAWWPVNDADMLPRFPNNCFVASVFVLSLV